MSIKVEQGNEEINSIGGISLVGNLLNKLNSLKKIDKLNMKNVKSGKIKHSGILKSITGLYTLAKTEYADIEFYRKDKFFRNSLKLKAVPSESSLATTPAISL